MYESSFYGVSLLKEAISLYDDSELPLARASHQAWQGGFHSGAAWMALALGILRNKKINLQKRNYQVFGLAKYGLAALGGFIGCLLIWKFGLALFFLPIFLFYFIEAHFVFLFPLAIDGKPNIVFASLAATDQAGGVFRVMWVVLQLAVFMLFGGFFKQGFLRAWCVGCLAVVLWYEKLNRLVIE